MNIKPEIFKAYDIRGKVPKELNVDAARKIGNAIAVFLSRKYKKQKLTLFVGSDVRVSSPLLKKALIEGVTSQGSAVVDIGIVTTPLFYFALSNSRNDGGVMVTASHNPPEYNGFKVLGKGLEPVSGESGLFAIKKLAAQKIQSSPKVIGAIREERGWTERYISCLAKKAKIGKARVVIDAAGGSAALILPKLLSRFPNLIYKPLFFTPDGTFSLHNPNPTLAEAQDFAKEELASGSFDFGVIFDGDGDRILFLDEFGKEVRGDFITALLAGWFLKKHRGDAVVLNVTASKAAEEYIMAAGGKSIRSKMGYVHISPLMRQKRAIVGGETSHHFYFRDFAYKESSMYALLKMLEIVSRTPKKLSHIVRPLQKYHTAPETNFSVKNKKSAIASVLKKFARGGKVSRLDGITVDFPDWWFNLRPSNTEPLVRLTIEANTKELFDEKQKEISDFINGLA
ncbi:MAG: phosphomannomutase/phosphoglucomutase [Candidatus Sungbacteria bacterium]|nr:phosphomannomutase/phosphoglucomutase [Candidatus Sungbacteria bacterium]